jgi:adenosine deaminase
MLAEELTSQSCPVEQVSCCLVKITTDQTMLHNLVVSNQVPIEICPVNRRNQILLTRQLSDEIPAESSLQQTVHQTKKSRTKKKNPPATPQSI